MSEQPIPIRWGDIVRIHGVSYSKKDQINGLIIAKGFTDSNIYYQKYDKFDDVSFYRQSLFQIWPKGNFDMHDLLVDQNTKEQDKENIRMIAKNQTDNLLQALQANVGKQTTYGSQFCLKHMESKGYLQGSFEAADVGQGAFKLKIVDAPSSKVNFRFTSHRSYEQEGRAIYYNDELQIYNPYSDCYMNYSQFNQPIYLDQDKDLDVSIAPQQGQPYRYFKSRPSIKKPKGDRIAVINENKSKCLWKMILHCTYHQSLEKKNIISHDIVYFEHTKKGGLISSTLSDRQSYLKEFESGASISYQCFWQLTPKSASEFGPQSCKIFRARNVVTGQLLTYEGFEVEVKAKEKSDVGFLNRSMVQMICSKPQDQEDVPLKLERGKPFEKEGDTPKIVEYFESKITKLSLVPIKDLPQDSFLIKVVDEQTTSNIMYALSAHEPIVKFLEVISTTLLKKNERGFTYKDWFRLLNEPSLVTLNHILRALSERIYGCSYEQIESSGNLPNAIVQKILVQTGIAELLIQCLYHLHDPFVEIERQRMNPEDKPIRNKVESIFENCYKLLERIAANNEDNRIYMSRWVQLLVQQSNNINRTYIQLCILGMLENNPVSIKYTINERTIMNLAAKFFSEVKKMNLCDPESSQQLPIKYLRLFSTFIKCEDQVIKENQLLVLKYFFTDQRNEMNFRFKVEYKQEIEDQDQPGDLLAKIRSRQVRIAFDRDQLFSIPEFFALRKKKWNYFLAWVDLLSDICIDRNSQAIEFVNSIVSLQTIITILFDSQIEKLNKQIKELDKPKQQELKKPKEEIQQEQQPMTFPINNVHQPFIRLAHHVYVNNQKFNPIQSIGKISNWYAHEDFEGHFIEEINRTKRVFEGQKQQEQKKFLQNLLIYIKNFLENCNQQPFNLKILDTVLNLLQATVTLGLWENMYSFKELIPFLIMRITKIENKTLFYSQKQRPAKQIVADNKESLTLSRPEITDLIKCKIKATNIFRLANQLEIDIRLRYLMNFFRGVYKTTEDFQKYNLPQPSFEQNLPKQMLERNVQAKEEYMKIDSTMILGGAKQLADDVDVLMKPNIWYHKLKQLTPFENPKFQSNMVEGNEEVISMQKIVNRYLFSEVEDSGWCTFGDIVLALFELPAYKNIKLINNSLKMLRAMFEQRSQLIRNFKAMLICGKGNLNQVYMTLKFMRIKFDMLDNSDILKYDSQKVKAFPYQIWKPYDHLVKDESKRQGIIQDLFFLARTLKEGVSLKNIESLMHVEEEVFDPQKIYTFITERERNNQLFQSLNMAQGIYQPLIGYIRQIGDNPINETHRRLLFSIYQYLTLLCFNNLEAKQILMKFIPDVIPHLGKRVGASNFVYQVALNNKLLVSNQLLVKMIIDGSLRACAILQQEKDQNSQFLSSNNLASTNDYEKSRIFFSLRGILLYNQDGNKRNQQLLMNSLQDAKYKQFIFLDETPFMESGENFNLSPKQTWVATIFQLLSVIVQSESFINIGKLQNIYKYTYLLKCLTQTNRWQIRRGIRAYINRLYYVNKDKDIFLFEQFVRSEFTIINKQLQDLISLHKSKMLTDDLKIKNGIRFVYAQSEIILTIIQIMITLHQMLLKKPVLQLIIDQWKKQEKTTKSTRKYHDEILRLLKNLGCMSLLYPKTKPISPFIREIKRLLSKLLSQNMQVRYLQKKSQPQAENVKQSDEGQADVSLEEARKYEYDQSKSFFRNLGDLIRSLKAKEKMQELKKDYKKKKQQLNMPQVQQKERYIDLIFSVQSANLKAVHVKPKEVKESHYNQHLITTYSKNFKIISRPIFEQNRQNIQLNKYLFEVKEMIDDLPIFKKLIDDEFNVLVSTFTEINKTSEKFYDADWKKHGENQTSAIYPLQEIISKKFELIRQNPNDIEDQQKIFLIKLVRCYITEGLESQQTFKLSVDKWGSNYFDNQTEEQKKLDVMAERQNIIRGCGGSEFLIQILKENLTNRVQLLNEALLFGIAYLYTGNTDCQNSILECLVNDPDNLMLANISSLINTIGSFLIEVKMIKQNQKKRQFAYKIVDTYDYYSSSEHTLDKEFGVKGFDKFEMKTEAAYEQALCRIFRFLQLFCENNNTDMKKFILVQTNQDQSKKDNSIDFIQSGCLLLRRLFKIMNNRVVSIPGSVLEFLKEVTQTPCINNQRSLMKSTFFEDISYMAEFFENKANILSRKFELNPGPEDARTKLAQIYETGIGLALSNFEGNDDSLQFEFISKCKPKYLWLVIRQNLLSLLKTRREHYGIQDITQDQDDDQRMASQLFAAFTPQKIEQLIDQETAAYETFQTKITNILAVLSVVSKISIFESSKTKMANIDKQHINHEQNRKAIKAALFLHDMSEIAVKQFPSFEQFKKQFSSLLVCIEVASNNGEKDGNQFVYFPKHPVFTFLADSTKDNIMFNVKRDTSRDKLITLLDYREQIYKQIQLNYSLKYKPNNFFGLELKFPITSQLCDKIKSWARIISLIIIGLMAFMILVEHDMEDKTSQFTYYNKKERYLTKTLCLIQMLITFVYFILWIKLRMPLAISKWNQQHKQESEEGQQTQTEQIDAGQIEARSIANQQNLVEPKKIDFLFVLSKLNNGIDFLFNLGNIVYGILTKIFSYISSLDQYRRFVVPVLALFNYQASFNSTMSFILATIAGNFLGVQWYTLHLFDFFVSIASLANVFKSVLNNIGILALLSGLLGVFTLVFNVVSLSTYTHVIYQGNDFPEQSCESIVDCVLVLYTSGAINGDMENFEFSRFLFDTGYVVVIEIMFMEIIGGMLMDAYQGLTQQDAARNVDKKNFCYICGMKKEDMQKIGQTFKKHTAKHQLWNYVYYIYCLSRCKPETDYTGIQYIITNQLKQKMVGWFPSNTTEEEGADMEQLLNGLEEKIDMITTSTAKLTSKNISGVNKGWAKIKKLHEQNIIIKQERMLEN